MRSLIMFAMLAIAASMSFAQCGEVNLGDHRNTLPAPKSLTPPPTSTPAAAPAPQPGPPGPQGPGGPADPYTELDMQALL